MTSKAFAYLNFGNLLWSGLSKSTYFWDKYKCQQCGISLEQATLTHLHHDSFRKNCTVIKILIEKFVHSATISKVWVEMNASLTFSSNNIKLWESTQSHHRQWWEQRKLPVKGLLVDPIKNSQN